jgi:MFS family permease
MPHLQARVMTQAARGVRRAANPVFMLHKTSPQQLTDSAAAWRIAAVSLTLLAVSFGAPWMTTVALKQIAAEVGGSRSVPAAAAALAWFGSGLGGILMGQVAEKIGLRWTASFGALMIAVGLAFSSLGPHWQLHVGHGLFIGLLGLSCINAPLYVYVSKWFDRRRGSALALISSGTYVAGALWPPIFERAIANFGWRQSMLGFAVLEVIVVVPLALIFLRPAPEAPALSAAPSSASAPGTVLGWPPNMVFVLLALATFLCCVTMSMPQQHLVAFCTDLGISASHGAAMLSLLLGIAFISRQIWGLICDRIGGLRTILLGSLSQVVAMSAFLVTQDEVGLIAVSAAFGLGFAGLIPAYMVAVRELFPARDASWRIPTMLLCSASGMATGGWLAGVIYDWAGFYAPAFATGVAFNMANLLIIILLVGRQYQTMARA